MANINSLTRTNATSSIYGTRNVLTGLSSGLDTEAMIENSVSGYKMKIESLKQEQDLIGWKQDAYGNIIDKATKLSSNFFSYGSSTNLLSNGIYEAESSEKLTRALKDFVTQYNDLATTLRTEFKTPPSDSGNKPLTESDKADMSENAIKNYEDKAKQGILYNDSDITNFYMKLTQAVSANSAELSKLGIKTRYESGLTTLSFDEDTFKSAAGGMEELHGLMNRVKGVTETYTSTSFSNPGILNKKASKTDTRSAWNQEAARIAERIKIQESRMSQKIDYYTRQFTALEKLMNIMNNQSEMLNGLMLGY